MVVMTPKHADDVSSLAFAIQDAIPHAFIVLLWLTPPRLFWRDCLGVLEVTPLYRGYLVAFMPYWTLHGGKHIH